MAIFSFGVATHVGNVRAHNEDSYFVDAKLGLCVVADGMGGHAAGDVASGIATNTIASCVGKGMGIGKAIQRSHQTILLASKNSDSQYGMGTTVVAVRFNENNYELAWVGDSRAYLWNDGLVQISKDQSVVQQMVDLGVITREEARRHPRKNIITQYVGQTEIEMLQIDYAKASLVARQKMILCSDGLSDEVGDDEVVDIMQRSCVKQLNNQAVADELVVAALKNGGNDNVTVIVLSF